MNRMGRFLLALSLGFLVGGQVVSAQQETGGYVPNPRAVSLYNLGLTAYKQNTPESAIIFFKRACDLDPNLVDAQYNLGVLYQSQKRFKEAVPRFEEVLRIKPNDADAHYQLGIVLQEVGRPGDARQHFAAIAPNSPQYPDAQKRLAQLNTGAGSPPDAGQDPQSLRSAPPNPYGSQNPYGSAGANGGGQPPQQSTNYGAGQPGYYQAVEQNPPVQVQGYNQSPAQPPAASPYSAPQATAQAQTYATQAQSIPQNNPPAANLSPGASELQSPFVEPQENIKTTPPTSTYFNVQRSNGPVPAAGTNATLRVIATGFSAPAGLAFDRNGNLYVANYMTNSIDRIAADGTRTNFCSGAMLRGPIGLAVDDTGYVYVANYNGGTVSRITPAGISTVIASGFKKPYYLTLDRDGNLYVSQQEDNSIVRITLPRAVGARTQ